MKLIFKILFVAFIGLAISNPVYAALDRKSKVSSNDSTAGYLNGKLTAGSNVTLSEQNDGGNETLEIAAVTSGSGITLDLADDASNESTAITEIATSGDTNSVFTEPTADKLLINLANDWPKADDADDVTCTGCVADAELATDFISETELDTEAELETQLTDVTNVFTNNDGALADDDISDDQIGTLSDVSETGADSGEALVSDGAGAWAPSAAAVCLSNGTNCPAGSSEWTDAGAVLEPNTDGDGINLSDAGGTNSITIDHDGTNALFDIIGSGGYRFADLVSCDTIDTDVNGVMSCGTDASGSGGTANILDLGDDASNESIDLIEIATTGDTNSIFTEPTADKLLITLTNNWPSSDTADALSADPTDCSANQFANAIAASGNLTCAQPTLSNLSDADSTTPADGHLLLYDGVTDNRYENKAMSGDVLITAAGATTIQPLAVDAGDYAAASIDGDDIASSIGGSHLTLTAASPDTLDLDAEVTNHIFTLMLDSPTAADAAILQHKLPTASTVTRVSCSTDTGTATIQLDERVESTPNTAGTDVMTSTLVCDNNTEATTTFTNAAIAADAVINLDVDAVASSPTKLRVHVEYTIDD